MLKFIVANVVFLLLINVGNINGWRTFTINLTNATSSVHSNKLNLNVTINNGSLNTYFTVKEQIAHPFVRAEAYLESPASGRYDMELINRTIDACELLKNSFYEPLMQLIYGIILEHGDFPRTCPVKPKNYKVENMYFDAERFPSYLPERKGYFKATFFDTSATLLSEMKVHFAIKNSALNRFKGVKSK